MENQTLKDVCKNSGEEVKEIPKGKFSKQDLGLGVNQEEFNQFFREILEKYKNNIKNYEHFSIYEIFDEDGKWLFEINYKPEYLQFCSSYWKLFPLFKEKFGINVQELKELMIPVLEQDLKLIGITHGRICFYSK